MITLQLTTLTAEHLSLLILQSLTNNSIAEFQLPDDELASMLNSISFIDMELHHLLSISSPSTLKSVG